MEINNDFYKVLGEDWYTSTTHPIALLRAETPARVDWLIKQFQKNNLSLDSKILDIGCGAGFVANALAKNNFLQITAIDIHENSLDVAKRYDITKTVDYKLANALSLPYEEQTFDIVLLMDIIEHIEDKDKLLNEAKRVLKPGGIVFFHTFKKNIFSYLFAILALKVFFKNSPENLHVYSLFIDPSILQKKFAQVGLEAFHYEGLQPNVMSKEFWEFVILRKNPDKVKFLVKSRSLAGYLGSVK